MGIMTLNHSKAAYIFDYIFYAVAIAASAIYLLIAWPHPYWTLAALTFAGYIIWSVIEYVLHRFLLHGLQPFSRWHAEHHHHPTAYICTPTLFSASLFVVLVFLPIRLLSDFWIASALTLSIVTGYYVYSIIHHATHHWRANGAWLKERKRIHALHHHVEQPGYFGVTSNFWDHVFRSARRVTKLSSHDE